MAGIAFYQRNKIDLARSGVTISITDSEATNDGQAFVDQLRDRKNTTGWGTTGSDDTANTEIEVLIGDVVAVDSIFMLRSTYKHYEIFYHDGDDYVSLVEVTDNKEPDIHHEFPRVFTASIKVVIYATILPDDDKRMSQLVITEKLGQLERFPIISRPMVSKNRRALNAISGKSKVIQNERSFSVKLLQNEEYSEADIALIEFLYTLPNGFLVWLCGGDEKQFRIIREGFRRQDLFYMAIDNENVTEMIDGFYWRGTRVDLDLIEAL